MTPRRFRVSDPLLDEGIDAAHDVIEIAKSLRIDILQPKLRAIIYEPRKFGRESQKPFSRKTWVG